MRNPLPRLPLLLFRHREHLFRYREHPFRKLKKCSRSTETAVHHQPKSVFTFLRNECSPSTEIRKCCGGIAIFALKKTPIDDASTLTTETIMAVFQVGAKLPFQNHFPYPGTILEYGCHTPTPTLLVAIDNPTATELDALRSGGDHRFGIATYGAVSFLLSRYAMHGTTALSADAPYHAGVHGNANNEFMDFHLARNSDSVMPDQRYGP
jgi:hypothetical protein